MKLPTIAPSLLSGDFFCVNSSIKKVEDSGASLLHLDVMDGHFVPNLTFGPKMISDIRKSTSLFLDTHLMISNPENSIDDYIKAGSDAITFHLEACVHANRLIEHIKASGKKAGISIVPSTPVCMLTELIDYVDMVLVMSVNPGFGGQKFIENCQNKVKAIDAMRKDKNLDFLISVDGGVNSQNYSNLLDNGADILVMGSAFFSSDDSLKLTSTIESYRKI